MSSHLSQTVRSATPEDAPAIARVHVASWRVAYEGLLSPETLAGLNEDEVACEWRAAMQTFGPEDRLWLFGTDGVAAGYARTGPNRDQDLAEEELAEVYGLYVHPDHWSKGVGRSFMEHVLEDVAARGYEAATLWVVEGNERARRFYERYGWTYEEGPTNHCFGAPEVRYRIRL